MIIITGASATGKTVTALMLQKKYGLVKAITTTTRDMRTGEHDGVDYFFLSKDDFVAKKNAGGFVETTLYNDNYYGCGIDQVADNKVVVVDPNGLHSFKALNDDHIVTFLLMCADDVREKRMIKRGDKPERIAERMKNDSVDFAKEKIGKTDCVIPTDAHSVEEVSDLVYKRYEQILKKA